MNYKRQVINSLLFTTLSLFLFYLIYWYPVNLGICRYAYNSLGELSGRSCYFDPNSAQVFFCFFLVIFISFIPLYFLKENIYLAWRKFALIYLPVVAVIIALLPQYSPSGIGGSILSFDREEATFTFSFFFALISLMIIIFKAIKEGNRSIIEK